MKGYGTELLLILSGCRGYTKRFVGSLCRKYPMAQAPSPPVFSLAMQRQDAEKALLKTVWDSISSLLVVVDAQGRVILGNREWNRHVPAGTAGAGYATLLQPSAHSAALIKSLEMIVTQRARRCEQELPWPFSSSCTTDGEWLHVRMHPIYSADVDKTRPLIMITHEVLTGPDDGKPDPDLSYRLLMNELAEARREAQVAQRAKSEFLSTMGHELRTPMNAIIGIAHMLQQNGLMPPQKDLLAQLQTSAQDLLALLNDLLDVSAIEAGRLSLCEENFHLDSLLQAVISRSRAEVERKDLSLSVIVSKDLGNVWYGDASRLHQILHSLLDNAVKFTKVGSISIEVSCTTVACTGVPVQQSVTFVFTDSGIGISPDYQKSLFAPFQQADSSHSRRYNGTGLGLALAHRLAALMNGDLSLKQSVENHGSTFCLTVPLLPVASASGPLMASQSGRVRDGDADLPALKSSPALHVPGFDLPQALRRLDGNFELFRDLLAYFLESPPLRVDDLRPLLDAGRFADIERLTHTLKGVSANLGATSLTKAAEAVMRTARAQDREGILATLVALRKAMRQTQDSARQLVAEPFPIVAAPAQDVATPLPQGNEPQSSVEEEEPVALSYACPLSRAQTQEMLQELAVHLTNNAMEATELYDTLKPALVVLVGASLTATLGRAIHHLDFSTGSKTVNEIMGVLAKMPV